MINEIVKTGACIHIDVLLKKDINKLKKLLFKSAKFNAYYPDSKKHDDIFNSNFILKVSNKRNDNFNRDFILYDIGSTKQAFIHFEAWQNTKWGIEGNINIID